MQKDCKLDMGHYFFCSLRTEYDVDMSPRTRTTLVVAQECAREQGEDCFCLLCACFVLALCVGRGTTTRIYTDSCAWPTSTHAHILPTCCLHIAWPTYCLCIAYIYSCVLPTSTHKARTSNISAKEMPGENLLPCKFRRVLCNCPVAPKTFSVVPTLR